MRVTKIIREYVEKTITTKMTFGEPTENFKAARKLLDEAEQSVEEKVEAYAKTLVEEANSGLPEGFKIYLSDTYSYVRSSHYDAPLAKAAAAHEREVREKRKTAIEAILLELELGATKADLERLIEQAINM
jgi:hypothetical protein